MQPRRIVIAALALMLGVAVGASKARACGTPAGAAAFGAYGAGQEPWDAPPRELNEIQRQGFHDGIEGARRDFENHRPPNVDNRDEYRHPHLPPEQREAYRNDDGGYDIGDVAPDGRAGARLSARASAATAGGAGGLGHGADRVQRLAAARVPRRDRGGAEGFRESPAAGRGKPRSSFGTRMCPGEFRDAYREGFRRGYDRGWAHLTGREWHY